MRARILVSSAALVGLALGLAAPGGPTFASVAPRAWTITPRAPTIHLLASRPCPRSVRGDHDVTNEKLVAREILVPPGPNAALICRYGEFPPSTRGSGYRLVRSRRLGAALARRLAGAIDGISTAEPTSASSCPAMFPTATVVAFGYASGLSADLWYEDSGCETIDDGYLEAAEVGHPQFYLKVAPLIGRLAPRGT